MKPDHFREADPKLCQYCKHIYRLGDLETYGDDVAKFY
jgi:hypothetical protein